ncbi:hypothetical protein [Chengkuizengella marina]|uniref:Uncharacterized protein n=1 Tax=Chengkuizengella marina TaxID=2507566 RepID=A0A6N9Q093_9BACL|nr:hypothetical protein [Chengkuizengella marina]NBI27490.1 hypothetical protein [Chengkuizengella marina]
MYKQINKQIVQTKERLRKRRKLKLKLDQLELTLQDEHSKLKKYKKILENEEQDVSKLESFSLTSLFYTVLGTKDKKLQKEKEEYLAAKLKYDESYETVSDVKQEKIELQKLLRNYKDVEAEYESILKLKKQLILQSEDENTKKLIHLTEAKSELQEDLRELEEAIHAGNNAKNNLNTMIEALRSAKNWGTYDMIGGGLISTAAKHSKIDKANQYAHQVQKSLRLFKNELLDVKMDHHLNLQIHSFEKFADYFFDGLIFDWIVQSKINNSLNNVMKISRQVSDIILQLNKQSTKVQNEIQTLSENILEIVTDME